MEKTKKGIENIFHKGIKDQEKETVAANMVAMGKKQDEEKQTFGLGGDTYAMAYKAFHWESAQQMELSQTEVFNAFHSSCIVSFI